MYTVAPTKGSLLPSSFTYPLMVILSGFNDWPNALFVNTKIQNRPVNTLKSVFFNGYGIKLCKVKHKDFYRSSRAVTRPFLLV
jgi:hypothetical protein